MPQSEQSCRTVPAHSGQKTSGRLAAHLFGKGFKQDIDRRPTGIPLWIARQPEFSALDNKMKTWWGHHRTRLTERWEIFAVVGVTHPQGRQAVEPLGKRRTERFANMNDEKNGNGKPSRESAKYLHNRGGATRRSTNCDNGLLCRAVGGCEASRGGGILCQPATNVRDHAYPGHDLHRCHKAAFPDSVWVLAGRFLEYIHCARNQRVICLIEFSAIGRRR